MKLSMRELDLAQEGCNVWHAMRGLNKAEAQLRRASEEAEATAHELVRLRRERLAVSIEAFRQRLDRWRDHA